VMMPPNAAAREIIQKVVRNRRVQISGFVKKVSRHWLGTNHNPACPSATLLLERRVLLPISR